MGKNSSPPQQTTTNKVELPDWVLNAAQANIGQAKDVSANLMQPYAGQRVADLTPEQLQTIQQFSN